MRPCWPFAASRVLMARAQAAASATPTKPKRCDQGVTMASSVTNVAFAAQTQPVLRSVASKNTYASRFWITQPQARRTANAKVLPGSQPTVIYLEVEKVIPLKALAKATQRRILDECPPFFSHGVGILSDRKKWRVVTAARLEHFLNKTDEERALFVDVRMAKELDITITPKDVIDVRSVSSALVYNAEQLDDPYKGEPQKGAALDCVTGKRLGQPAHDILLGVGIMRGYASPIWVGERQAKHLNLQLRRNALDEGVVAPNMVGMIVPLTQLPKPCRDDLLRELKKKHPHSFGSDVFYIFGANGWEAMRSRILVKHMTIINDPMYPYHFVNLFELGYQKPQYHNVVSKLTMRGVPIGPSLLDPVDPKAKDSKIKLEEGNCAVQTVAGRSFFFADDATLRRFYNAECFTKPHLAFPPTRQIAVVNGRRLAGPRDQAILRTFALKHKFSSPFWLSELAARRLGVTILKSQKSKFVTIGALAADTNPNEESVDSFYNLEDFSNPEEILAQFPKSSKNVHFMLDAKWRPVLGKQRQDFLSTLKRETPLWVSVNECMMSGFEPKPGARPASFPKRKTTRQKGEGLRLYNSQQTSDPVRVLGLSTMLVRPQGLKMQ